MRLTLSILIFTIVALACSNNGKKETVRYVPKGTMLLFDTVSGKYELSSKDTSLITSWQLFAEAAVNADFISLKSMSTNCIYCLNCFINADEENNVMGVEEFYNDHAKFIFNSLLVSRMNNSGYVRGAYKTEEWLPNSTCISENTGIDYPKVISIHVSYPLRKDEYEGTTAILEFIETKSGYKFYGYSTIP